MKKAFYFLALVSVALLGISLFNLATHTNSKGWVDIKIQGKGFNISKPDAQYNAVKDKLLACIKTHKKEADKNQQWYFWLNFIVTSLTAGSTLVSSIQAAKDRRDNPSIGNVNKFAVIVAILTFLSTLTNFGATQFNERKNNAAKSVTTATQDLNDFYRKYDASKSDEERNLINREYDQKICMP